MFILFDSHHCSNVQVYKHKKNSIIPLYDVLQEYHYTPPNPLAASLLAPVDPDGPAAWLSWSVRPVGDVARQPGSASSRNSRAFQRRWPGPRRRDGRTDTERGRAERSRVFLCFHDHFNFGTCYMEKLDWLAVSRQLSKRASPGL